MTLSTSRTFVIAEAGVNHNGSAETATRLVDIAADAGADAVKFQTFKAERVASATADKAEYQKQTTSADESQLEMLRRLEMSEAMHDAVAFRCRARGIQFLSTPFDPDSLKQLTDRYDIPLIKVPSGEITNALLLYLAARTGRPIILSTGMSDLEEIESALGVLASGYLGTPPRAENFRAAYNSGEGLRLLRERVTLLHCTTAYPTPEEDANLLAMDLLRERFGLPVGYSDHTPGIAVALAAVARGARVIEKHFTLSRSLPGPDHAASLEPGEIAEMILGIRAIEKALGRAVKSPAPSEVGNLKMARRSLVTVKRVRRGEAFTRENLDVRRPLAGVPASHYWDWLGKVAERDYSPGEVIVS